MKLHKNSISLFLLLLLLLALPTKSVLSQTKLLEPSELYIGTTQGITSSMVHFDHFSQKVRQNYNMLGYTGGIALRYITEKHWGLHVEANYSQRGWTERDNVYARQLNYVEVPFLTHYYLGDKNRFIIQIGPKFGYFLNEKVTKDDGSANNAEQHRLPVSRKFDYGGAVGLGYNYRVTNNSILQWELRVYYGLSNIYPDTKRDYFSYSNNISASMSLGYFFNIGKKK